MGDMLRTIGEALALGGALLTIVSAIGVLRFPDFYSRIHAASITDTLAASLVLLGLGLIAGASLIAVKLLVVWVLLIVTSPVAAHALANAARAADYTPVLGAGRIVRAEEGGRDG